MSRSRPLAALPAFLFLVAGCAVQMVSLPGSSAPSQYGPVNESSRPGLVKYLNKGVEDVRPQRREDAYRQMHSACSGKYRIDGECPRAEGGVVAPVGSAALFLESQYWYIQFSCVQ